MATSPLGVLRRFLDARRSLIQREQQVLDQMIQRLPDADVEQTSRTSGRKLSSRKTLSCPRCDRRFALPMHLGRHLAMSHRRRKAA
jgi:hypothetical protein